jgi:hypothetical protein
MSNLLNSVVAADPPAAFFGSIYIPIRASQDFASTRFFSQWPGLCIKRLCMTRLCIKH